MQSRKPSFTLLHSFVRSRDSYKNFLAILKFEWQIFSYSFNENAIQGLKLIIAITYI